MHAPSCGREEDSLCRCVPLLPSPDHAEHRHHPVRTSTRSCQLIIVCVASQGRSRATKVSAFVDSIYASPTRTFVRLTVDIVHEHGASSGTDVEVVVVLAGDGEVPHPASRHPRSQATGDRDGATTGGAQLGALLQGGGGSGPVVGALVPEQVAAGRLDHRGTASGADLQVIQVLVLVDQDRGDRLSLGSAGPGVRAEDLVAGLELADRHQRTREGQHLGIRGEIPTAPHPRPMTTDDLTSASGASARRQTGSPRNRAI